MQLYFLRGFLLLFSYLIVKALREAFMLTNFSAEVRAYAVTLFFASNMLVFSLPAWAGVSIAFVFYVWVSIFGVMMIAQFWVFAADSYNIKSGQRLLPVIMMGANLGALAGAKTAQLAVAALSPVGLMLLATLVLTATLLLALLVVLLNWINTTGEFILADFVQADAERRVAQSSGTLQESDLITPFYGNFQFWVTLVGLCIQLFLVSRLYRHPAVGPRTGQKLFTLQTVPAPLPQEEGNPSGAARAGALSLHAGVLAPHSKLRAAVTPPQRGMGAAKPPVAHQPPTPRRVAMNWAKRLKHVFGIEINPCQRCVGRARESRLLRTIARHPDVGCAPQSCA